MEIKFLYVGVHCMEIKFLFECLLYGHKVSVCKSLLYGD